MSGLRAPSFGQVAMGPFQVKGGQSSRELSISQAMQASQAGTRAPHKGKRQWGEEQRGLQRWHKENEESAMGGEGTAMLLQREDTEEAKGSLEVWSEGMERFGRNMSKLPLGSQRCFLQVGWG